MAPIQLLTLHRSQVLVDFEGVIFSAIVYRGDEPADIARQVQLEEAVEQLAVRAAFRKQDEPHPAQGCGFHQLSW